jgi:FkbM family methyltransferase
MGIPFFFYGSEPDLFNHADPNIELGKYNSYKTPTYLKVRELFNKPVDEVTLDQKLFVNEELGVNDTISRSKMAFILYSTFLSYHYFELKKFVYKVITFNFPTLKRPLNSYRKRVQLHYDNYKKYGYGFARSFRAGARKKTVRLFGYSFFYTNEFWFLHGMHEIFIDKTYWFKTDKSEPLIIDCGSNIGLSLIYFKKLYPKARIIAFEPDPSNFEILNKNLHSFHLNDVQTHNKAIWKEDAVLQFASTASSVGSKIAVSSEIDSDVTSVAAVDLSGYLKEGPVDFLKIDIEGAEFEVINACSEYLSNVKNLFIEYHSLPDQPQQLHALLGIIQDAGFRYYLKEAWQNMKYPFVDQKTVMYDLQVNIFCYR